jgi:hypothetical protein
VFSGGCELCKETVDIVEVGKCKDCKMEVVDVKAPENADLIRHFRISAVPSIVIDGRIKVVGKPSFPWFCGDEFYRMLESKYPLKAPEGDSIDSRPVKKLAVISSLGGGGLGAALCTVTMLLPLVLGASGAGAAVACSMPGMCLNAGPLGNFVNGVTRNGPPLLVASLASILYGMRSFGRWPLAISAAGGAMLYASMFVLNMYLPFVALSSFVLIMGYVAASYVSDTFPFGTWS